MEAHSLLDQEIPRLNGVPSAEKDTPEQRINQWQLSAPKVPDPDRGLRKTAARID